jgi:hypothetical protein
MNRAFPMPLLPNKRPREANGKQPQMRKMSAVAGVSAQQRHALALLAGGSDGCTEALLVAHGVSIDTMVELVHAGLASVTVGWLVRPRIEVARLTITDAGREAIG